MASIQKNCGSTAERRVKSSGVEFSAAGAEEYKKGEVVRPPESTGRYRGVPYIYGMFYRFGLIDVPDEVKEKMGCTKDRKK